MRQYKKLRFFTFAFALLIAICSCEKQDITNHILTEQLELSTYDISKMSEKDFKLIGKAIQRLDITRDQYGFYTIKQTSGAQINISEELFKFVKAGYEHTNQIIYSDLCSVDSTFLSTKSQYPLPPDDGPKNCVAHALAGMGV
ncbi:MAG: hypothetical protein GX993_05805 [Bacteroidales bacterium]|nr:hypothetical protein [Bacteroidales bacterium]